MDNGDSGPGAQWEAPDLHDKMHKSRHILLSFDGARRVSGLGAAAWILWLRGVYGSFVKVSHGGRVLRNASAMTAEREALRMGIELLTVLFPTEVSSFDFQVESSGRTVQYKLNAQSLRLFGLHSDVNDAHRAGANRLQNKIQWLLLVKPLRHVITQRWPCLVSGTGDDPLSPPPPYVDSDTPLYRWTWSRYTRGRFECTHGGVSESTYGFFQHA